MPAADTARLIASLELNDSKFRAGATRAIGSIDRIDRRLGAFSGAVNRNLGRLVDTAVTRGTQILVDGIKGGIDSLAQLEDATTAVDGALRTSSQNFAITGSTVAKWANEIEAATDAAFDDKDITRSTANLIRYGKVTPANLKPAMVVMTDLAARTGSVETASNTLAKALADPAKAAGVLKKAGVVLTKQQQDQIKAMVKAGKVGKAQTFILQELAKSTKGAAAASKGEFGDMQNTLRDTVEDAQRVLGEAAFPVLKKLGEKFKAILGDKATMDAIRGVGQAAAGFLDQAIAFGEKIPWASIKDALVLGGQGAKTILDAFLGMPAWVQTAVITGWGLNKVTGGLITSLASGLIKGVLGMTAGVVHIKAGVVTGAGGGPPIPGMGGAAGAAGAAGGIAPALPAMGLISVVATGAFGTALGVATAAGLKGAGDTIADALFGAGTENSDALKQWGDAARQSLGPFEVIRKVFSGEAQSELAAMPAAIGGVVEALQGKRDLIQALFNPGGKGPLPPGTVADDPTGFKNSAGILTGIKDEQTKSLIAFREGERSAEIASAAQKTATTNVQTEVRTGLAGTNSNVRGTTGAVQSAQGAIVAAINGINVSPVVHVGVTTTSVERNTTVIQRYGPTNGSYGGRNNSTNIPT